MSAVETGKIVSARLRVLHCPLNTAGQPGALARAEREIGLESRAVSWVQSPFAFPCDEVLWSRGQNHYEMRLKLLRRAIHDFDVIHFNWGESIFPPYPPNEQPQLSGRPLTWRTRARDAFRSAMELLDVPLLRVLGKVIAVTFQGDDARQGDYIRDHFEVSPAPYVPSDYYTAESDAWKRNTIRVFDRHADLIYAVALDVLHVLPPRARFLCYATVDPREWQPVERARSSPVPVVVHAPTHRQVKGTSFVLEAVARLKSEGVPFEFLLVENLQHSEAKACYRRADLLIDQLLVGNYGALAVEVMALGTPVVSYVREGDLRFMPQAMRDEMPVINATPSTIYGILKDLLTVRRGELTGIGQRSRAFVERWYDPRTIAEGTAADYERAWRAKRLKPLRRAVRGLEKLISPGR